MICGDFLRKFCHIVGVVSRPAPASSAMFFYECTTFFIDNANQFLYNILMLEKIITSFIALCIALGIYASIFNAVDPHGDWGMTLAFAGIVTIVYCWLNNLEI